MASDQLLSAAMRSLNCSSWQDAENTARAAIADDPTDPHAVLLLGLAIAAMGEDDRAAPVLLQAAAMRPNATHPCLELVQLRPPLPRTLISRQFRACLRLAPADARLRLAYAEFLLDIDQPTEAEAILADGPDSAEKHHLLGLAQAENNQFAAAISSFQRAVALNPCAAASWSNLGMSLKVEGRFAEAIVAHDRAVALDPGNHRLRVNRAVGLLKMGAWEPAWLDYESRLQLTGALPAELHRLLPSLRPGDSLAGLTILALHEDGFGDTLQFLRYIPMLAERGATVVACVPPSLVRVMRGIEGVSAVIDSMLHAPSHDFVCPMFSLPRVFGTRVDTIPPVPAFVPEPALVQYWGRRLPAGKLRAGLVWAGQARPALQGFSTLDRRRSAGLAAFAPLFDVPGVAFVSLQAGPAARQRPPGGIDLLDLMPDVGDFADTAAIIAGLDVVISVDTSVVHLAGLVGKPVFLLDRYDGCWRWLTDRPDSPWYPHLTIFRQTQPDDWSDPMARAAAALETLAVVRRFRLEATSVQEPAFIA